MIVVGFAETDSEVCTDVLVTVSLEDSVTVLTRGGWAVIVIIDGGGGVYVDTEVIMEVVVDGSAELVVMKTVEGVGGVYVEIEVVMEVVVEGSEELVVTVMVEAVGGLYVDVAVAVVVVMEVVRDGDGEDVVRVVVVMLMGDEIGVTVMVEVEIGMMAVLLDCESCSFIRHRRSDIRGCDTYRNLDNQCCKAPDQDDDTNDPSDDAPN